MLPESNSSHANVKQSTKQKADSGARHKSYSDGTDSGGGWQMLS